MAGRALGVAICGLGVMELPGVKPAPAYRGGGPRAWIPAFAGMTIGMGGGNDEKAPLSQKGGWGD